MLSPLALLTRSIATAPTSTPRHHKVFPSLRWVGPALLGLLLTAPHVAASERYLELVTGFGEVDDGGVLTVEDDRFGNVVDSSYDSGFRSGLAFGWQPHSRFAIEAEYLYSTNDLDQVSFDDGRAFSDGNFASVVISGNGYVFFRPQKRWKPYLGAGLAWVQEVDIDFEDGGEEISFETDELGFQLMAGFLWDFGDRWSLDLQARWLSVSDLEMEAETGGGRALADYEPASLLVGFRYRF